MIGSPSLARTISSSTTLLIVTLKNLITYLLKLIKIVLSVLFMFVRCCAFLSDPMATPIFCVECRPTKSVCGSDFLKCNSCRRNLHKACFLNNAVTNHNEKKRLPCSSRQTQILVSVSKFNTKGDPITSGAAAIANNAPYSDFFDKSAYFDINSLNRTVSKKNLLIMHFKVRSRGGVEDTGLEAKAKDTKKIRGQGQGQEQPFRGQTLSRPRTGMLEAKDQGHKRKCSPKKKKRSSQKIFKLSPNKKNKKKGLHKIFQAISKKKVFTKIFQAISTKKRFPKKFSSASQNFNNSKNSAVLEPRTGQFSRT